MSTAALRITTTNSFEGTFIAKLKQLFAPTTRKPAQAAEKSAESHYVELRGL